MYIKTSGRPYSLFQQLSYSDIYQRLKRKRIATHHLQVIICKHYSPIHNANRPLHNLHHPTSCLPHISLSLSLPTNKNEHPHRPNSHNKGPRHTRQLRSWSGYQGASFSFALIIIVIVVVITLVFVGEIAPSLLPRELPSVVA
ncbi:hypothetical protein CC80DRAFT_161212 [Byssothecium circinans]|uniref:Uncharacterized protein n=1 Tax=Byssothecium circinans TaxID=147558 RepID=A0A6A5UDR5_9PLEO|nr:hypothetical protein CC80DRAFT_161212 [Byssothecium circinans]